MKIRHEGCRTVTRRRSKRSKKISKKGKEESLTLLPVDLILEIFSRLPPKSIGKCRCVSKLLASVLSSQDFTDLFLAKSSTRPRILFACKKWGIKTYSFPLSQVENVDKPWSPLVVDRLTHLPLNGLVKNTLISRIGGFLGFVEERTCNGKTTNGHVIYNPLTGRSLTLPLPKLVKQRWKRVWLYRKFGYDPVEKQFKILYMTNGFGTLDRDVHYKVLTVGAEKQQWRMIECGRPHKPLFGSNGIGICINGVLYYLAKDKTLQTHVMVCFDVRYERFSFFDVMDTYTKGAFVVYNDKLALLQSDVSASYLHRNSTRIELIVIGDFKKQEWSKHTYILPPSWKTTVGECLLSPITFVGVTRTNEIVLWPTICRHNQCYLFVYNMVRSTFTRVEISGMNVDTISHVFLDCVEDLKFIGG